MDKTGTVPTNIDSPRLPKHSRHFSLLTELMEAAVNISGKHKGSGSYVWSLIGSKMSLRTRVFIPNMALLSSTLMKTNVIRALPRMRRVDMAQAWKLEGAQGHPFACDLNTSGQFNHGRVVSLCPSCHMATGLHMSLQVLFCKSSI